MKKLNLLNIIPALITGAIGKRILDSTFERWPGMQISDILIVDEFGAGAVSGLLFGVLFCTLSLIFVQLAFKIK